MKDTDEIEGGGWRAWRYLFACLAGGGVTLVVWRLAPPGYAQVTAVVYVAGSLGYAVWDGWALRWAIPVIAAVTGFFVLAYLGVGTADVVSALRARTSLPTLTLVGVILWAVLASVIAVVLDRRLQKRTTS